MKGYVGESCPECGNFTMVRNGTCLNEVRHLRRHHGVLASKGELSSLTVEKRGEFVATTIQGGFDRLRSNSEPGALHRVARQLIADNQKLK
jgi:hypothetical protein